MQARKSERLKKKVKFDENASVQKKKKGLAGARAPSSSANERLIKQWRGMDS